MLRNLAICAIPNAMNNIVYLIKIKIIILVIALSFGVLSAQIHYKLRSVGATFSTFGIGASVTQNIFPKFDVQAGLTYFNYKHPLEKLKSDMRGDVAIRLGGLSLTAMYHPLKYLYFSGGGVLNFSRIAIDGILAESVMIGDIEMLPEEVGRLKADITLSSILSPYIGVGLGQPIVLARKFSYTLEFGVLFHGKPIVDLSADGLLEPTASDAQETLIEENIAPLTFLPVITFSINYNFPIKIKWSATNVEK